MGTDRFLACDFGADSGRVILGRIEGNRLSLEEIHRFPNRLVRALGHYHWDLLALFAELKAGLLKAASQGHRDIDGIGVDTWGVDFGLLDRNGKILSNPVSYRDSRTNGMLEAAFARIDKEKIYGITGIQFLQLNTLYQLLSLSLAKDLQLECAGSLLFMPDLFNYLMTGEQGSEYTIASTSQLLDAVNGTWSVELADALGLPSGILPSIREPGSIVGSLLPEIAEETGLRGAQVIAPACHDTACAVAAVPAEGSDWAYLSSGTWSLLGVEIAHPIITPASLANNFTNEGGFARTIRFLRNNMGMWLLERCRKAWAETGSPTDYAGLLLAAGKAEPFRSAIDPDDPVFLNPPDMPDAIVAACRKLGQPVPRDQGEMVRTILESLALKYRWIFDQIREMQGKPISRLHIVGGGSRNGLLNRFTADALGIPVLAGPVEATAAGNILIQAIARGTLSGLQEARALVRSSFEVTEYLPANTSAWEERYHTISKLFQ